MLCYVYWKTNVRRFAAFYLLSTVHADEREINLYSENTEFMYVTLRK